MNTRRAISVPPKQNQATRSLRRMTEALPSMGREDDASDRFFATNEKLRFAPLGHQLPSPHVAPMGYESVKAVPQSVECQAQCGTRSGSWITSRAEQNLLHNFQPGENSKPVVPGAENRRVQVDRRPPYIKMEILSQKRSCSFLSFIAFYLPKRNFLRTRTAASALYSSHDARDFLRMGDNRHLDLRRWTHWCTSLCFPRSNEGAECRT
jgi:hypothetical protein